MKGNRSSTVLIKEIAAKAGISQSTVSIVLNGRGDEMRISKKTQEMVKEIAREMGYRPNIYARRLRNAAESSNKLLIAIFWNKKLLNDDMSRFFLGASDTIDQNAYGAELVVKLFEEDHLSDHLNLLNSQTYNGIIVIGMSQIDVDFLEKESFDIPVVLTSRIGHDLSSVYVDNYEVGRTCAKLFYDAGKRKAGIVRSSRPSVGSVLRLTGFREACLAYGIECRKEWEVETADFDVVQNEEDFGKMLSLPELPDCLFVQRSLMSIGIYTAASKAGVRIPEDMVLLGCGLKSILEKGNPSISMVGGSMENFGRSTVDLMMMMVNNHITKPINTITPPVFLFNDSFRPAEEA